MVGRMLNTHRKVSTVVAADVLGYSQLMGIDEEAALAGLERLRDLFTKTVTEYGGSEFGSVGDSLMADFPSAVDALDFAIEMQHRVTAENDDTAVDRRLTIRIGLNLGDVMVEDGVLFGDGVNVASRLQALAPPGGIVISGSMFDLVDGKVEASFQYHGEQAVKNIAHPVRTYLVADAGASRSLGQAISELARRRIFRSAATYVIVAWLMIQVADVVLPAFDAPRIILRSLVIVAIVGFPLAMVFAWSFNLGSRGLVATPNVVSRRRGGRWLPFIVVGGATGLSAIVLWTVWNGYLANPDNTKKTARQTLARIEQPVIAVVPFEKTFGDADIDWLGSGLANLVRHALADSRQTVVYSAPASQAIAADLADSGVDYMITGNYLSTASGLVLSVEIDPTIDHVIVTETIEADSPEQLLERVDDLTRRLFQRLSLPSQKQVGQYSADFASSNASAYELFVGGLQYFDQFDYVRALESFRAALELAPDFAMARYRLAQTLESIGENRKAFETLTEIDIERLDDREKLYVEGALAKFNEKRDIEVAINVFKRLVDEYPFDSEAHQNLAESYWYAYKEPQAIEQLKQLVELHPRESSSWMALAELQADIGDSEGAEYSLARYSELRPEDAYPYVLAGQLALADAEFDEARRNYEQALEIRPDMGVAEWGLARVEYFSGAKQQAFTRWNNIRANKRIEADYRIDAAFDEAASLQGVGRFSEAITVIRALDEEIANEGFREALALTVMAVSFMEMAEYQKAHSLLNEAIDKTPASGFPTRQLFFLGMLARRSGDNELFDDALDRLQALALPSGERSDRTRNGAVSFLLGLKTSDVDIEQAVTHFRAAVTADGFHYRLYEVWLADALQRAGHAEEAGKVLASIGTVNLLDPRLDLELDRARAERMSF